MRLLESGVLPRVTNEEEERAGQWDWNRSGPRTADQCRGPRQAAREEEEEELSPIRSSRRAAITATTTTHHLHHERTTADNLIRRGQQTAAESCVGRREDQQ